MNPANALTPETAEALSAWPMYRPEAFRFGAFILCTRLAVLQRHGLTMSIGSRALIVLTTLVEALGNVVDHDTLVKSAWPDTFVDEANLRVQISAIRRVLGTVEGPCRYIENQVGRGYRVGVPVQPIYPQASDRPTWTGQLPSPRAGHDARVYFGSFCFDPTRQLLLDDGSPVQLGVRAVAILSTLLRHAGEMVAKEELVRLAWPAMVDDVNLRVHLAAIRRALRDCAEERRFVANVSGRGYRFVAPLQYRPASTSLGPLAMKREYASAS